jgi:hypothetical protein
VARPDVARAAPGARERHWSEARARRWRQVPASVHAQTAAAPVLGILAEITAGQGPGNDLATAVRWPSALAEGEKRVAAKWLREGELCAHPSRRRMRLCHPVA